MSNPEAPQPEATLEAIRDERSEPREKEGPQDPGQRQFLKTLFGGAGAIAGLAVAGELLNPTPAEAAYSAGGANNVTFFNNATSSAAPGDLVNTNLRVDGHLAVKGFRPWIDVTAYTNTAGSPFTDARGFAATGPCDTGVAAAFAALPDIGGIIYFPPGHYYFNNPINYPAGQITIAGAGRGHTVLVFMGSNGGIHLTNGHSSNTVTIRDLTIASTVPTTTPAIRLESVWTDGWLSKPHIHDVEIRKNFKKGIELLDGSGAKIERFDITGEPPNMSHGIHLLKNPAVGSGGSSIVNIAAGFITGADVGIEVGGPCEGTYVRGIEVVGGRVGYKLVSPNPGSAITDCHAMTTEHGIYIVNHGEMALTGNLLYGTGPGTYTGIYAEGTGPAGGNPSARRIRITGNAITDVPYLVNGVPQPRGGRVGMFLKGTAYDNTIQGNVLTEMDWGIVFDGGLTNGTNYNVVIGNRIQAAPGQHNNVGVAPGVGVGMGNIYALNLHT